MPPLSSFEADQSAAIEHLRHSLAGKRLHHAFLLMGSAATPLWPIAQAFAHRLICPTPNGLDACGTCQTCRQVSHGSHPDFLHLAPNDRGVIPVATVRRATQRVTLRAAQAPRKVVLLQDAGRMPTAAQNALLKTLEEPPNATVFVLTTPRSGGLLATVRSRCTALHLQAPTHATAVQRLAAAGVPNELGELLAPLVGGDNAAAQHRLEQGLAQIVQTLHTTLAPGMAPAEVFAAAQDLGQNPERTELTLLVLEVLVRDGLAQVHGAHASQLYHPSTPRLPHAQLAPAAAQLRRLRALGALHINRTMALEGLFFTLIDTQHAHHGTDA
jgi:DNA polymerase-3 subunit delta'